MQIAHFVQGWARELGGGSRYLREISLRAAAAGHEVTVMTTNAVDGEYFWDPSVQGFVSKINGWEKWGESKKGAARWYPNRSFGEQNNASGGQLQCLQYR